MPFNPWLGLLTASVVATRDALQMMSRLTGTAPHQRDSAKAPVERRWTSRQRLLHELSTMRVREFPVAREGPTVILVAPYALHAATTADFARGHSVVEALIAAGVGQIILTDWISARESQRYLSIDSCLADLNVVLDDASAPAALVGLCQGGLLAAIYAARFPGKVSRLALVGAPLDIEAAPSALRTLVNDTPPAAVAALLEECGGILPGELMKAMWPASPLAPQTDICDILQISKSTATLRRRYEAWDRDVMNLPGVLHAQMLDWIFRENRFARGVFLALGQMVGVGRIDCPLFLLAAAQDEIVSPPQLMGAAGLVSTPKGEMTMRTVPGQHLSLFVGREVLDKAWPEIGRFLVGSSPSRSVRI